MYCCLDFQLPEQGRQGIEAVHYCFALVAQVGPTSGPAKMAKTMAHLQAEVEEGMIVPAVQLSTTLAGARKRRACYTRQQEQARY